jgi:hypothetical protein
MTPGTKALIAQAAANLSLENLVLHESRFSRPGDLPDGGLGYGPQYKRVIGYNVQGEGDDRRLVVKVDLGVRLAKFPVEEADKESEPHVAVVIEADFLVIFRMKSDINTDCIEAFSDFNAVHNAWPFWRHHVFDIVQRGHLPQIEIPLQQGQTFDAAEGDQNGETL